MALFLTFFSLFVTYAYQTGHEDFPRRTPASAQGCNGMESLCDRAYDQVVYPTTHNATAMKPGYGRHPIFLIPNQTRTIAEQLEDGVRGFMIDLWYKDGEIYTCHHSCGFGGQPIAGVLQAFKTFFENHPNEVVSILFENYVTGADLEKAFIESGLITEVRTQDRSQPWPTLRQMIREQKRLVVFKESEDNGPAWDMLLFQHAVETKYSFKKIEDFTCDFNRGLPENKLFILNHFLTRPLFRKDANRKVNGYQELLDWGHRCMKEKQKVPNFLTVDFYTPDLIDAAKQLNSELN